MDFFVRNDEDKHEDKHEESGFIDIALWSFVLGVGIWLIHTVITLL